MNIKLQRTLDRYVGVTLLALMSVIKRVKQLFYKKKKRNSPQRILIILLSEMGSLVLAHPMFLELKQRYPNAQLYLLMFEKNRQILDLMDVMPRENVLTINDKNLFLLMLDSMKKTQKIRDLKFDIIIDCELFSRVSALFSCLSGAPIQVGFHSHTQKGLYRGSVITHPVLYNPYRHLSQQFIALINAIESTSTPTTKVLSIQPIPSPPLLHFSDDELQKISIQFYDDYPMIKNKKLVLIFPSGGILPIRAWPLENYCQLSSQLLKQGYAVGIIGKNSDKLLGQHIVTYCNNKLCVDLTGYDSSVRHLLALFQLAHLLIANDGGISQFAALTPIPVLTFFGPETPLLYGSNTDRADYLYLHMACSPCFTAYNHRTSPCDGDNQCLKQIKVDHVLSRALEKLTA